MSEEIIKITIDYVLDEVKEFNITNLDGLCFYFSQQTGRCQVYGYRIHILL